MKNGMQIGGKCIQNLLEKKNFDTNLERHLPMHFQLGMG
jgi:hypothetical protein